jgi:GLPGLI family protein
MMPHAMTNEKVVYFNGTNSVYREAPTNKNEDIEMSSDDGSFKMVIKQDDTEDILYTDLKAKSTLHQTGFMGKEFLIQGKLEKRKWQITDERIKYLGYVCQKATLTELVDTQDDTEDESNKEVERQIVAWFTTEIPVSIGPGLYNQLPGAILMVSVDDGKTEIKATHIDLSSDIKDKVMKPTKGDKVTAEEYDKIVEEKMKEMKSMYGGDKGAIFIRG